VVRHGSYYSTNPSTGWAARMLAAGFLLPILVRPAAKTGLRCALLITSLPVGVHGVFENNLDILRGRVPFRKVALCGGEGDASVTYFGPFRIAWLGAVPARRVRSHATRPTSTAPSPVVAQ